MRIQHREALTVHFPHCGEALKCCGTTLLQREQQTSAARQLDADFYHVKDSASATIQSLNNFSFELLLYCITCSQGFSSAAFFVDNPNATTEDPASSQ